MNAEAFAPNFNSRNSPVASTMQLNGLFDGMKEAFSAPALERSSLDAERETPIDRWMGWNVEPEEKQQSVAQGTLCCVGLYVTVFDRIGCVCICGIMAFLLVGNFVYIV
jgi:hypothetical protein